MRCCWTHHRKKARAAVKGMMLFRNRQGRKLLEDDTRSDVGECRPTKGEMLQKPRIITRGTGATPSAGVGEEGLNGVVKRGAGRPDPSEFLLRKDTTRFFPSVGKGDGRIVAYGVAPAAGNENDPRLRPALANPQPEIFEGCVPQSDRSERWRGQPCAQQDW